MEIKFLDFSFLSKNEIYQTSNIRNFNNCLNYKKRENQDSFFINFDNYYFFKDRHIFSKIIIFKENLEVNEEASVKHVHTIYKCILCDNYLKWCKEKQGDECSTLNSDQTTEICNESYSSQQRKYLKSSILLLSNFLFTSNDNTNCLFRRCNSNISALEFKLGVKKFTYNKYDDILISIERKYSNFIHPAVSPIELPRHYIKSLLHKKGIVLDIFGGLGTTGVAALLEGNQIISVDLDYSNVFSKIIKDRLIEISKYENINFDDILIVRGDINDFIKLIPNNSINMIYTSPPYFNLLNHGKTSTSNSNGRKPQSYSYLDIDFGNLDFESYLENIRDLFFSATKKLKLNGVFVLNLMGPYFDPRKKEYRLFPSIITEMLIDIGLTWAGQKIWDKTDILKKRSTIFPKEKCFLSPSSYEVILHFIKTRNI